MVTITRVFAFALRFVFFGSSFYGLFLLLRDKEEGSRPRLVVFGSIAALFVSEFLTSLNIAHALRLAVIFFLLLVASVVYGRLSKSSGGLFLPVALLVALGMAVGTTIMGKRFNAQFYSVIASTLLCLSILWLACGHVDTLATLYKPFLVFAVVLCCLPLVPFLGKEANGATSWIAIEPLPAVQPSEFAKVALVIGLAGYCAANTARLQSGSLRGLFPLFCALSGALGFELFTKDMGTAMVLFAVTAAVVMAASGKKSVLYAVVIVLMIAVILAAGYASHPYVRTRFDSWLNPTAHVGPNEGGAHLLSVQNTISNGGVVGTGLGLGHEMWMLPEADNDSIYVVIVEELGLLGGGIVLLAMATLLVLITRTIKDLPKSSFESNVLVSVLVLFGFQTFVIIGGLVRVIPFTGVTLPFVSRGGSSMVSCFMLLGLCGLGTASRKMEENNYSLSTVYLPALLLTGLVACFCFTVLRADGFRLCGYTEHCDTGTITTSDGVDLAITTVEKGRERRKYPQHSSCVHVLGKGQVSGLSNLTDGGIEYTITGYDFKKSTCNKVLNLLGIPETLGDTVLTIDSNIQAIAEEQLSDVKAGAIVVLNNNDGSVLAEASWPSYDIEELSRLELESKLEKPREESRESKGQLQELRASINNDGSGCLLNRTRKTLYAPGSTFKIVTASAALQGNYADANTALPGDTITLSDGSVVTNFRKYNYGKISLSKALELSSNTAFASLALQMKSAPIQKESEDLGYNVPMDGQLLFTETSTYVPATTDYSLAWAAVGQPTIVNEGEQGPRTTVLQMARVMAAVANGGTLVTPHLIKEGVLGQWEIQGEAASHSAGLSDSTVNTMYSMLKSSSHVVCESHDVLGKTGTAETSSGNNCWYVCSSEGVTVAVCVEGEATQMGYEVALPRGLAVLDVAVGLGDYSVVE